MKHTDTGDKFDELVTNILNSREAIKNRKSNIEVEYLVQDLINANNELITYCRNMTLEFIEWAKK